MKIFNQLLAGVVLAVAGGTPALAINLQFNHQIALPGGGEIVAYTPHQFTLATTFFTGSNGSQAVNIYNFLGNNSTLRGSVSFSSLFGANSTLSVSSVALDPLGRGFGVATVIPTANTATLGKLAFFDYTTGNISLLHSVDVGYHPDSVTFAPNGSRIIVANEGEASMGTSAANDGSNAPGSVSIIDVSGITNISQIPTITSPGVIDFTAPNRATGVNVAGLRNPYNIGETDPQIGNTAGQTTFIANVPNFGNSTSTDLEPEYAVISDDGTKAYISLQENNAIAVLDLTGANANKYTALRNLGTITKLIDATDTGATANISQSVRGLPMPDTIATITINGTRYIVTANEGDARVDDRDLTRFGDIAGGDSLNPIIDTNAPSFFPGNQTGVRANSVLGRLNISRVDGDTDGDAKIDTPTMIGTRSFSLWDADTGVLVADSVNLETTLLLLDPTRHNINRQTVDFDNRSDDKGPEPEALAAFQLDGMSIVAIGLERQNGVLLFDVSDLSPDYITNGYINGLNNNLVSPESILFISAAHSPNGVPYLVVGFEGVDGTGANAGLGIYNIPEPSTGALLAGALAALAGFRRRRRA